MLVIALVNPYTALPLQAMPGSGPSTDHAWQLEGTTKSSNDVQCGVELHEMTMLGLPIWISGEETRYREKIKMAKV